MPLFEYTTFNARKKISALLDANNLEEAKSRLRASGICFLSLREFQKRQLFGKHYRDLKGQNLVTFTQQLAQLLASGIPLYESLLSIEEQVRHEKFHPIIISLCEHIKKGNLLSQGMSHFPDSFSSLYCSMVNAGETIGALDSALLKLGELIGKHQKIKKNLWAALSYPILLGGFSILILGVLLGFVVPSIETIFEGKDINRFTASVISLSHFIRNGGFLLLPAILAIAFLSAFWIRVKKKQKLLWKVLLAIPILKNFLIQTDLARFARTLASLLEGGTNLIQSLLLTKNIMKNPLLEEFIASSIENVSQGSQLSHEFKKNPWIPPLMIRYLYIGEESGNSSVMLKSLATIYEEDIERTLTKFTSLIQPIVLLFLGGIVGLIMLAVLIPLTDVTGFIGE